MKKFNRLSLIMVAVLSTMLFACEDQAVEPAQSVDLASVNVKGTLYVFDPVQIYSDPGDVETDIAQFEANGSIELEGLETDWFEARHSHVAYLKNDGSIKYEKGEFEYQSPDGSYFYGRYDGFGTKLDDQFEAVWLLTIEGGTGKYAKASGQFRETIMLQKGTEEKAYNVEIEGSISLPDYDQFKKIYR